MSDEQSPSTFWLARPGLSGAAMRMSSLILLLALLAIPSFLVSHNVSGETGVNACRFAFIVCLSAGLLSLLCVEVLRYFGKVMWGILGAMAIRMMLPLGVVLAVVVQGGDLVDNGAVFYLLMFYFVVLVTGTYMEVAVRTQHAPEVTS